MLTTVQLRSPVFDRLTGRRQPKLEHPTSAKFDLNAWAETIADDDLGERDGDLVGAAAYIGELLAAVRTGPVAEAFAGLSADEIVELAIANANRHWAIFRLHLHQQRSAADGEVTFLATMGLAGIPVGPDGALVSPDAANNAIVDGLPYWFFEAGAAGDQPSGLDTEALATRMQQAHFGTNLLQTFRAFWQQVLWEPYRFRFDEAAALIAPGEPEDLVRWRAWEWREQVLAGQRSILNRNIERNMEAVDFTLPLTAVAIHADGITVGPPSDAVAASHRSADEIICTSYAKAFLGEELGGFPGRTPLLLERAVCVLQDLMELMLPHGTDPGTWRHENVRALACAIPRQQIVDLLQETLGIEEGLADATIDYLTADPFSNLGPLFNAGLWHKPLVRSRDAQTIMLVGGALVWGMPIRRAERWLQESLGEVDLSDTPAGLRYEAALRDALAEALKANKTLAGGASAVNHIPHGARAEEIDLLLRIGSMVIVGEVKCLVAPAEPVDRSNHIRKLEKACAQASRKAAWLAHEPELLLELLGEGADQCRLQPLLILNQSAGVEWEYHGCPITDARFMELFARAGEMTIGGFIYGEGDRPPDLFTAALYTTPEEAEATVPKIFLKMPGMDPFRDSIIWDQHVWPMGNGATFTSWSARQDVDAYVEAMKDLAGIDGDDADADANDSSEEDDR